MVGMESSRNCPPPFMRSTKKRIRSRAKIPARILFVSFFCSVIRGTAVNAATRSMEAVVTEKTPSPPPTAMEKRKVRITGMSSRTLMISPAFQAAVLSFLACRSRTCRDSVSMTRSTEWSFSSS